MWQERSSDWDGEVLSYEGLVDALEKEGDVTAVSRLILMDNLGSFVFCLKLSQGKPDKFMSLRSC